MFARLHDQGRGFIRRLACNFCKFVGGQIRKIVQRVHASFGQLGNLLSAQARQIAQAHGSAELRIISGAGHRLRHDPRALAILLGWLDRQRNQF